MGIIAQGKGLWNALFTRTQRQVLSLTFGHPERSFYANEVVRLAGVGTGSVQRELARLSEVGLLKVTRIGNQKHYQANPESPVYGELRSIVVKTFGAVDLVRTYLAELDPEIQVAFLYGDGLGAEIPVSPALDLLVVSANLEYADVVSGMTEMENNIGRTINLLLFSPQEFAELRSQDSPQLSKILKQPRVMLAGRLEA